MVQDYDHQTEHLGSPVIKIDPSYISRGTITRNCRNVPLS